MATSVWMTNYPMGCLVYLPGIAQPVTIPGATDANPPGLLLTGGGGGANNFGPPTTLAASSASILAANINGLGVAVSNGNVVIISG